jgi:hypothetical protein
MAFVRVGTCSMGRQGLKHLELLHRKIIQRTVMPFPEMNLSNEKNEKNAIFDLFSYSGLVLTIGMKGITRCKLTTISESAVCIIVQAPGRQIWSLTIGI